MFSKDSPPRETKKKLVTGASTAAPPGRPAQPGLPAERSFSVSEGGRAGGREAGRGGGQNRTPHRTAGYGGAGHPNRGPHR